MLKIQKNKIINSTFDKLKNIIYDRLRKIFRIKKALNR